MGPGGKAVVAAVVGLSCVGLVTVILNVLLRCRSSCRKARGAASSRNRVRGVRSGADSDLTSIFVDQSASYDPSLAISMAELLRATENFADDAIIGDGGFGLVYRACLSSGVTVAAKKLSKDAFQGLREFRAEMDTLGRLRHDNIVKILGFCAWGTERILVYEFMENGSLDQWLHDGGGEGSTDRAALPWERRVRIVRGVANGLRYLHGLEAPIIHRDIKAGNVLLDGGFEPHIADFGLARMVDAARSHVSTQVAGTMGYMPPEYREGLTAATVWADVYSFGVLMLEVGTARRPSWPVSDGGTERRMVEWASGMAGEGREMEMMDPNLRRSGAPAEREIREFFRIACMCTREKPRERPAMNEVVKLLDRIREDDEIGARRPPVSIPSSFDSFLRESL